MDSKANMQNYSHGDVMAAFKAFSNIIDKNDGLRNFSIQDNSCFDAEVPFPSGTQTHLKITNNNHDLNQLGETFVTAKVKLALDNDTFTCISFTITELKCSSYGYKVNPSIIKELSTLFNPSNPYIIPAEFVDIKKFSQGSDGSSIDTDFSNALYNCTDAIFTFPKDPISITCYENPMLRNLQLTIDGKFYPVKSIETVGERFFNIALTASNLEENDKCTEEYEDSLTRPLNDDAGTRFPRTWKD